MSATLKALAEQARMAEEAAREANARLDKAKKDEEARKAEEAKKRKALPSAKSAASAAKHAILAGERARVPYLHGSASWEANIGPQPKRVPPEVDEEFRRVLRIDEAYTALRNDGLNGLADFWGISRPAEWKNAAFPRVFKAIQSLHGKKPATVKAIERLRDVYSTLRKQS